MSSPIQDQISRLRSRGFDRTRTPPDSPDHVRVGCSRCAALVINGTPCHETGCPNARRTRQEDTDPDPDIDCCAE